MIRCCSAQPIGSRQTRAFFRVGGNDNVRADLYRGVALEQFLMLPRGGSRDPSAGIHYTALPLKPAPQGPIVYRLLQLGQQRPLLFPNRLEGIDLGSTERRKHASRQGSCSQDACDDAIREWIGRADVKQQLGHQPRQRERTQQSPRWTPRLPRTPAT